MVTADAVGAGADDVAAAAATDSRIPNRCPTGTPRRTNPVVLRMPRRLTTAAAMRQPTNTKAPVHQRLRLRMQKVRSPLRLKEMTGAGAAAVGAAVAGGTKASLAMEDIARLHRRANLRHPPFSDQLKPSVTTIHESSRLRPTPRRRPNGH